METLWDIFAVFFKIGAFTIGGGYAMIPLIQAELEKRKWMDAEELPDLIALAQSAPGVLSVNVAVFTGYRLRGVRGSLAAALGCILPSFTIILAIALLFAGYQDNPVVIRIFSGIRPAVIALILVPTIRMARRNQRSLTAWTVTLLTLFAVAFLGISPIYILIVVLVLGVSVTLWRQDRSGKRGADSALPPGRTARNAGKADKRETVSGEADKRKADKRETVRQARTGNCAGKASKRETDQREAGKQESDRRGGAGI